MIQPDKINFKKQFDNTFKSLTTPLNDTQLKELNEKVEKLIARLKRRQTQKQEKLRKGIRENQIARDNLSEDQVESLNSTIALIKKSQQKVDRKKSPKRAALLDSALNTLNTLKKFSKPYSPSEEQIRSLSPSTKQEEERQLEAAIKASLEIQRQEQLRDAELKQGLKLSDITYEEEERIRSQNTSPSLRGDPDLIVAINKDLEAARLKQEEDDLNRAIKESMRFHEKETQSRKAETTGQSSPPVEESPSFALQALRWIYNALVGPSDQQPPVTDTFASPLAPASFQKSSASTRSLFPRKLLETGPRPHPNNLCSDLATSITSNANFNNLKNSKETPKHLKKSAETLISEAEKLSNPVLSQAKNKGLDNVGNTCFMNALIQQIRVNPYLRQLLKTKFDDQLKTTPEDTDQSKTTPEDETQIQAGRKFIEALDTIITLQELNIEVPRALLIVAATLLEVHDNTFEYQGQNDTQELLMKIFAIVEKHSGTSEAFESITSETYTVPAGNITYKPEEFEGTVEITKNIFDPSKSLEIPVLDEETCSLEECIMNYFTREMLAFELSDFYVKKKHLTLPTTSGNGATLIKGDPNPDLGEGFITVEHNDGTKNYLKVASGITKITKIEKPPQCLCITLKRKLFTREKGFFNSEAHISLPEQLTIPGAVLGDTRPKTYKLVSCTKHWGGPNGGHYTTYARDLSQNETQFTHYNDEYVTKAADLSGVGNGLAGAVYVLSDE